MKALVTIICCYNDEVQYAEFRESLSRQNEDYVLIGLDNVSGKFSACSVAFNSVISNVETKYVIFSHQDIVLRETNALKKFLNYLKDVNTYDIVGVAGVVGNCKYVYTNITDEQEAYMGRMRIEGIKEMDTIDECFFGGTTKNFQEYPFDEKLCNNWHLYAVERCLNARINGNHAYACDVSLVHKSRGKLNRAFIRNFCNICKRYSKQMKCVRTTCAFAYTGFIGRTYYLCLREIKNFFGGMINRC